MNTYWKHNRPRRIGLRQILEITIGFLLNPSSVFPRTAIDEFKISPALYTFISEPANFRQRNFLKINDENSFLMKVIFSNENRKWSIKFNQKMFKRSWKVKNKLYNELMWTPLATACHSYMYHCLVPVHSTKQAGQLHQ